MVEKSSKRDNDFEDLFIEMGEELILENHMDSIDKKFYQINKIIQKRWEVN